MIKQLLNYVVAYQPGRALLVGAVAGYTWAGVAAGAVSFKADSVYLMLPPTTESTVHITGAIGARPDFTIAKVMLIILFII